jgi:uncharacterized membrane protein
MKKITIAILILILLSFSISIYSYNNLETDKVASHWNAEGEVDDYMGKFWGLFLLPIISIALYLLFLLIPKIDPLKSNIKKFRKHYDWFMFTFILFMTYISLLTILANHRYDFNMTTMLMPAIGAWFFYIGSLMKQLKRNWFIGVRTPWTLSSDLVWEKTHKLTSKLFKIVGIIIIFTAFLPARYLIWFILVPIFIILIWVVLYSYLEFKKEKRKN